MSWIGILVVLTCMIGPNAVAVHADGASSPSGFQSPAALTNADIIKMVRAGLSESVILAAIDGAPQKTFDLSVAGLIELKNAGVSERIMLALHGKRAEATVVNPASAAAASPSPAMSAPSTAPADFRVRIRTGDDEQELTVSSGTTSHVWAYLKVLQYSNYLDLKARTRIRARKPALLVSSREGVANRVFLVRLEPDRDDNVRSVRIKTGVFGTAAAFQPDEEAQLAFNWVQVESGVWQVTPTRDLRPGEYGLLDRQGRLWDFGIDP